MASHQEAYYRDEDTDELLKPSVEEINSVRKSADGVIVYRRRWYILLVFSLHCFVQNMVWNTWSPIQHSCYAGMGWTIADISLLLDWGPIMYIIATPIATWLLDRKGLRVSCVINMLLVCVGAGLRCITLTRPAADILIHAGQILNGLAGPIVMATAPLLSATWFPVQQRTLATALGAVSGGFGISLSFIIAPLIVPDVQITDICGNSTVSPSMMNLTNCTIDNNDTIVQQIRVLMYIEFGMAAVALLAILIYFPARPPTPPSLTASQSRMGYIKGIKSLMINRKFWILAFVYSTSLGTFFMWQSLMDVIIQPFGFSERFAGWLGFASCTAGNISPIVFAVFADLFARNVKIIVICQYVLSTVFFTVLTMSMAGAFPLTAVLLYTMVIGAGTLIPAACPIFYEMVCEISYPVSEGVTSGILTCLFNAVSLVFLSVLTISALGTAWTTWATTGAILVCVPVIFFLKPEHSRLDIDTGVKTDTPKQ